MGSINIIDPTITNIQINNDVSLNYRLFVVGDVSLNSNLYVKDNLTVDGKRNGNYNKIKDKCFKHIWSIVVIRILWQSH